VAVAPDPSDAYAQGVSPDVLVGEMVFRRCNAVVVVVLPTGTEELVSLISYAKRLDTRLANAICSR